MSNILITFLGASQETRSYRSATYSLKGKAPAEHTFIAAYLLAQQQCDKLIMVGTAKSMWEEVYKIFAEKKGNYTQSVYEEIAEYSTKANYQTPINQAIARLVETALPEGSKAIFIKYGLDNAELDENIHLLLETEAIFNDGDTIRMDITHSFRSLPLMGLMLIQYIREVSLKKIKFDGIYYGMLDISREMQGNITPVVNLNKISTILNWIKVVNSIKERYDFNQLAQVLKEKGKQYKALHEAIAHLNVCIQANLLTKLEEALNRAQTVISLNENLLQKDTEIAFMVRYVSEFAEEINGLAHQWQKNLSIALKHHENGMIGLSVLALWEAFMDKMYELRGIRIAPYEYHQKHYLYLTDLIGKMKRDSNPEQKNILSLLKALRNLRNNIAHGKNLVMEDLEKYDDIVQMLTNQLSSDNLRFIVSN
jgi:CRISPR-associated Csx2 family protein